MIISRDSRVYPQNVIERIVRNHMRLTPEDAELYTNACRCLRMAFDTVEEYTNRIIVPCDMMIGLSHAEQIVELPTAPVSKIISITYYDESDSLQTLGAESYSLTASEHRTLIEFFVAPTLSARRSMNRMQITCRAGYGDCANTEGAALSDPDRLPLPGFVEAAVQLLAGTYFEAEGDVIIGRQVNALPITAQRLLNSYRIMPYGGED